LGRASGRSNVTKGESTRIVTLQLDTDADPISGEIGEAGGPSRPFVGWLGLAAALERVFARRLSSVPAERPTQDSEEYGGAPAS